MDVKCTADFLELPQKRINNQSEVIRWKRSEAFSLILSFILSLNDSIKSKRMDTPREPSATVKAIVTMIDELRSWIAEIPPAQQPSRFGNISFRVWQVRLAERSASLQSAFLPETMNTMVLPYFTVDPFAPPSAPASSSSSTSASSSSSSASCPASSSHEPGVSAISSVDKPKEQQDELAVLAALTAKLDKVTSQISSTAPMLSKPPVSGASSSSASAKPASAIRPRPLVPMAFTKEQAIRQLTPYLLASFGDKQRIDYGTGLIVFGTYD